jgi:hypothetical protein
VAAFPLDDPAIAERRARIAVDLRVEAGATPTDSFYFSLSAIPEPEWRRALSGSGSN